MAKDSTFLRNLLASQIASIYGQVCDNDSSINESDCEALIASSDDKQKPEVHCNVNKKSASSGLDMFGC